MIENAKNGLENQENTTKNTDQDNNNVEKVEINAENGSVETEQNKTIEKIEIKSTEDKKINTDEVFISEIDADEDDEDVDNDNVPAENDFSNLNNEEIIEKLKQLIYESNIEETRKDIDLLKRLFYRNLRRQQDALRQEIIEATGNELEVSLPKDPNEDYLKELWA